MTDRTLDLDSCVVNYITDNTDLPVPIEMGISDRVGQGIVYVIEPMDVVRRFMNGRVRRSFAFQFFVKMEDWQRATEILDDINRLMEQATAQDIKSSNHSFQFISAHMTKSPSHKSTLKDAGKTYSVYGASFVVDAVINNLRG